MPQIVSTDIGDIEFPDEYTPDQMRNILIDQLPRWRANLSKGAVSDFVNRAGKAGATQVAHDVEGASRFWQNRQDSMIASNLRQMGIQAALEAPVGEEHKMVDAGNQAALEAQDRLFETKEERIQQNPTFQFSQLLKQGAEEAFPTNPSLDQTLLSHAATGAGAMVPKVAESMALGAVGVPPMLAAGAPMALTKEGEVDPVAAAIAAGTVPAFGLGESIAAKFLSKLPIKRVDITLSPQAPALLREAQEAGRAIQGAPAGFINRVEQKLGGLSLDERGRKAIEQISGVLAANAYLGAVQAPGILALPEGEKGPAIADLLASNAAMSLLGFLPALYPTAGKTFSELRKRIVRDVNEKYGVKEISGAWTMPDSGQTEPTGPTEPTPPATPNLASEEQAAVDAIRQRQAVQAAENGTQITPPFVPIPEAAPSPSVVPPAFAGPPEAPAARATATPEATTKGVEPNVVIPVTGGAAVPPVPPHQDVVVIKGQGKFLRADNAQELMVKLGVSDRSKVINALQDAGYVGIVSQTENGLASATINDLRPVFKPVSLPSIPGPTAPPPRFVPPLPVTQPQLQPVQPQPETPAEPSGVATAIVNRFKELDPAFPQKAAEKNAATIITALNTGTYSSIFDPNNRNSRQIFEEMTGVTLPKTLRGTQSLFTGQPIPFKQPTQPEIPNATAIRTSPGLLPETGPQPQGIQATRGDALEQPPSRGPESVAPREAQAPQGHGEIKQGVVGQMLGSGEVVRTSSGRETTPFPEVRLGTERKTAATVQRVDAWLRENAIAEAQARGDDFNTPIFEHSNPKSLSQADKDSFEEYLFGQQPAVIPSILKPITPQGAGAVAEPAKKTAEEQSESDMVLASRNLIARSTSPEAAYNDLVAMYNQMPRLGTRTAQSKTAQAYSTPPPLAFLASRLAGITPETRGPIAEPTAGNGMLLIGTGPNATIIANELDPNRNARLIQNFPRSNYSMIDATTPDFHSYLSQWAPSHIVMNPPFGRRVAKGETASERFPIINAATGKAETSSIDLAIALNSLDAMAQNGRAVVIIGSKTGTMGPQFGAQRAKDYERPEMLEFFNRFNVTDWFTVSGDLYKKMGAGWPVDVIVINGKGATLPSAQGGFPRPWVTPPKVYNSWAQLKEKLYATPVTPSPPEAAPAAAVAPVGGTPAAEAPIRRPIGGRAGGTGGQTVRPNRGGGAGPGSPPAHGASELPGQPGTLPSPAIPEAPRPAQRAEPEQQARGPAVVPPRGPEPAVSSPEVLEPSGVPGEASRRSISLGEGINLLNVPYLPVSKLGGGNLVAPKNLADAMSRAVATLESDTGQSVDTYVASKLGWSKEQLKARFTAAQAETVALFIRNLEVRGTGLIDSSATGVGKGRAVAGVIHYALKNGKIPIFVTAKKQLYSDMAGRDLPAVGQADFVPFITDSEVKWMNGKGDDVKQKVGAAHQREVMEEIARSGRLPPGISGIFTTYDQLKADKPQGWEETPRAKMSRKKKFIQRPDGPRFAMLRALAPNAIFVLDEAHVAAGQDSDVGLGLQSILPNAHGVYYASATFAKRPDTLTLYALGTAMQKANLDRKAMAEVFAQGGVPLQQAVTAMLAETGEFVRREQNMQGVEFKFEANGIDPEKEAELADTYTSFLRDLFQLSEQVNATTEAKADSENQVRAEEQTVDISKTNFGSRLFNLSSQYLFSLRSAATIQKAIAALQNGQKPFIAVYNTMAGPIADLQALNLPISFGGLLEREMLKMLEIKIKDPLSPGDPARGVKKGFRLEVLEPEELPDGGRFFYQIRDQIRATDWSQMPISPIDTIKNAIKKAGYSIGELTGRAGEVEEGNESDRMTKREIQDRNKILSDFNNGQLDGLIVNSSADTGVSAHTDPRFKDQRQRHMIIAQPNPDINGFMQIVGRVMRFGQTKLPVYTIISSSLATERRFNTMLRAKLNSLNANTTADTESSITQGGLSSDIFNFIGDEVVARVLADNLDLARLALIDLPDPSVPESMDDFARRATGLFVLLPNQDADRLWTDIADTYNATIKALDDAGDNPLRADVVDLRAKTTKTQVLQEGTGKTLFDGPVVLETAEVKPPVPALTAQQAQELAVQGRPLAEQKAEEWLGKFQGARQRRLETMQQRGSTEDQIRVASDNFERTRQGIEEAVRFLGEPVAVASTSGGGVDFYGVPTGLMLKSENVGDFSGLSKHSIVIATNSLRRQITIPLSQLGRLSPSTFQAFETERDASGIRHIVTGNLLRGTKDALSIAGGTTKPKVTIYSTDGQQVKTGVLMAPGWRPDVGLRALAKPITSSGQLQAVLDSGKLVTAGPVLIRGNKLSVPSRGDFRAIWGDPAFGDLFETSPVEHSGSFDGALTTRGQAGLFDFLKSKSLTPSFQPEQGETPRTQMERFQREPGEIKETNERLDQQDRSALERAKSAVVNKFGSGAGAQTFKGLSPDLTDNGSALRLGLGDDSRRAIETAFGHELLFFRSIYPVNGFILPDIPGKIFLNVRAAKPLPTVISHELMHWLKLNAPDVYARLSQVLREEIKESALAKYAAEYRKQSPEASDEEVWGEMKGDFVGHESQKASFWKKMAERLGPDFARVGNAILSWLRGLVQKIRGFETSEFFRDVERVQNALADAMAEFSRRSSSRAPIVPKAGESKPQFMLDEVFKSKESLDEFLSKPTISAAESQSLRTQAGARAGLVPDSIADEIRSLNPEDRVERRIKPLLDFLLRFHDMAPALDLERVLSDPNITEDTKQAAIAGVLRQIEHVKIKAGEIDEQLLEATKKLARATKALGNVKGEQLVEAQAKAVTENLVAGYKAYLTAQAANLPADRNLAAARADLIRRLDASLTETAKLPNATIRALEAIADRIDELPVSQGPQAVIDAIRAKGILNGVVGQSIQDMLLAEKPGGLPPLLLSPTTGTLLQELADVKKRADTYAKQIGVIEQAFHTTGGGEPKPVELRRWAETYRRFRNKQAEATKAIAALNSDFRHADENVQVYGRSADILNRLQDAPDFRGAFERVLARPGGERYDVFKDIQDASKQNGMITYLSPWKQPDDKGNEIQKEYRVNLDPTREADTQTVTDMLNLVDEIDQFLAQENVDPLEAATWKTRRDYIRRYTLPAAFGLKQVGQEVETTYGNIRLNPTAWLKAVVGGTAAAARSELERMSYRAARDLNDGFLLRDHVAVGYNVLKNNRIFGDEATKVAVLEALKSHGWDESNRRIWNDRILNPILASNQTAGQMKLGIGDYVPGTAYKITRQDMDVARMEKQFSHGVVRTTQGTAPGVPKLLAHNPVLIEAQFAGKTVLRGAISPGPLTMARRFSVDGQELLATWQKQPESSRALLIRDGTGFKVGVLSYVTTTNPEFARTSPLNPLYEAFTASAKNSEALVQNFDELVDRLAQIGVDRGAFPTRTEAIEEIGPMLIKEASAAIDLYGKQVAENTVAKPAFASPEAAKQFASANNPFTKARVRMVAPDAFYDYTLTFTSDRIGFVAQGLQMFDLRNIKGLGDLITSLESIQKVYNKQISDLEEGGNISQRKATAQVQKRSKQELAEKKFTYNRLVSFLNTLRKIQKAQSELVIDERDPNDSIALYAISRFQSTLSSGLLLNPVAIANNTAGGILAANFITQQNLGRANLLLTSLKSGKHSVGVLVGRFLAAVHAGTPLGAFARANLPLLSDMAKGLYEQLRRSIEYAAEAEAWGLRAPQDMRNRLKAIAALKGSFGHLERKDPSALQSVPNALEALPVLRWLLAHLRDKSPRAFDEFINEVNARSVESEIFDRLRTKAVNLFKAREELGHNLSDPNYFSNPANLITPEELDMPKAQGFLKLENLRDAFHFTGSLDTFLLDYYNRWKAAPENERANVPLFENRADHGLAQMNIAAHGNMPTAGFTPPSMQGVGQRGLIKRALFMFRNYPTRMLEQLGKMVDFDPRDPVARRRAAYFWSMFATLVVIAVAGMIAYETGSRATKMLTGRSAAQITMANILEHPDAANIARYVGMALANNVPYYGGKISQMLGNPGYGNWWDATDLIPIFGLLKDSSMAISRMAQTHDPLFPAVDFLSRWFPPAAPLTRLIPGVEGDIEARNAARALRVVGPSEGFELAGGGGGSGKVQTPVSAAVRRLLSAAYNDDAEGVRTAFAAAVEEQRKRGNPNPERAVIASLAAHTPARTVFGRSISPEEEIRLMGHMSGPQRVSYTNGQNAFRLINQTLGTRLSTTSVPRAARRRSLTAGSGSRGGLPRIRGLRHRSVLRRSLGFSRRSGIARGVTPKRRRFAVNA